MVCVNGVLIPVKLHAALGGGSGFSVGDYNLNSMVLFSSD